MLPLWRFFTLFFKHPWLLAAGLICIPTSVWIDIQISLEVAGALNELETADEDFLNRVLRIIVIISTFRGILRFGQRWFIVGVSRRVEARIKQDVFDRLTNLSLRFHKGENTGDLASRITSDVEAVRMLLGPGLMHVISAVTAIGLAFGVLTQLDSGLTLWLVLPLLLLALSTAMLMPRLHRASMAVQERIADLYQFAQENFGGIRVVKGYGLEDDQRRLFSRTSRANHDAQLELAGARGLSNTFTHASHDLCNLPILLVGGLLVMDGTFGLGDLFLFIDLTIKVFWPVLALGWILGMFPRAVASAQRIEAILGSNELQGEDPDPLDASTIGGSFVLDDVGHTYPGADEPSLANVNLSVPAGSTLGVVGPTGSGKTTLLHLFERLYRPDGRITLDDEPLERYDLAGLRRAIGHVPQDGFLFGMSYRDNLELGADEPLSDERIWELLEVASIDEEVRGLEDGLQTLLGERGVNLSGGQRQRTAIARALAGEPRVLILDDALSAVDTHTEAKLLAHLKRTGEGRTVILAAHRLSVVRAADQILVLEEGRPTGLGTHAELVETHDWYRDAWQRQQAQDELEALP